ncbi:hypothetical protein DFH07DRAFT_771866 [Mycena maculata]|uniref:Uncharacterized protein n=1 Tax=Mycena maculata TaxID=230809 RepID=A0AAD7J9N3_9AGAR|nr:hypothetical protein DFH07DRAFT_771866 [Mycena maculata]
MLLHGSLLKRLSTPNIVRGIREETTSIDRKETPMIALLGSGAIQTLHHAHGVRQRFVGVCQELSRVRDGRGKPGPREESPRPVNINEVGGTRTHGVMVETFDCTSWSELIRRAIMLADGGFSKLGKSVKPEMLFDTLLASRRESCAWKMGAGSLTPELQERDGSGCVSANAERTPEVFRRVFEPDKLVEFEDSTTVNGVHASTQMTERQKER